MKPHIVSSDVGNHAQAQAVCELEKTRMSTNVTSFAFALATAAVFEKKPCDHKESVFSTVESGL
jgi:hypothetical protein